MASIWRVLSACGKGAVFRRAPNLAKNERSQYLNAQYPWSVRGLCDSAPWEDDGGESGETEEPPTKGNKPKYSPVDPETSIRYMESEAYFKGYGNDPVWTHYRRNLKGTVGRLHHETRKKCTRLGYHATGSPCPICRDHNLVPHFKNVELLKQFISHTGEVMPAIKTGICKNQHRALTIAILQARDKGYLEDVIPFRQYTYEEYYPHLRKEGV